jgi:hypothetical protein
MSKATTDCPIWHFITSEQREELAKWIHDGMDGHSIVSYKFLETAPQFIYVKIHRDEAGPYFTLSIDGKLSSMVLNDRVDTLNAIEARGLGGWLSDDFVLGFNGWEFAEMVADRFGYDCGGIQGRGTRFRMAIACISGKEEDRRKV